MDSSLFRAINDFAKSTSWLHGPARFYAGTAGPALLALLVIAGFLVARRRSATTVALSVWAGLAPLVAVALNQPLVHWFDRPRPFVALDHVLVLSHRSTDPSMPSDHATLAGSVLAALFLVDRRLGWLGTGAGLLLAASRVYVGAHYPGDVLAGLALGATVALIGARLAGPLLTRLVESLGRTRLRPLVTA